MTEKATELTKENIDKLPEILKVRIEALREVNPKHNDNVCLELSSLATQELLEKLPGEDSKIPGKLYRDIHKKYNLDIRSDVNPYLVSELFLAYKEDQKNGVIDSKGKIIGDIEQSSVMNVSHNFEHLGIPKNATKTIAKIKNRNAQSNKQNIIGMLLTQKGKSK